jgi:hypothetical protein
METFEFQIVTETRKQAQRFMEMIAAEEPVIEEWIYPPSSSEDLSECYGFGLTHHSPKGLRQIADKEKVKLVYVKNCKQAQQEIDLLCDRVLSEHAGSNIIPVEVGVCPAEVHPK